MAAAAAAATTAATTAATELMAAGQAAMLAVLAVQDHMTASATAKEGRRQATARRSTEFQERQDQAVKKAAEAAAAAAAVNTCIGGLQVPTDPFTEPDRTKYPDWSTSITAVDPWCGSDKDSAARAEIKKQIGALRDLYGHMLAVEQSNEGNETDGWWLVCIITNYYASGVSPDDATVAMGVGMLEFTIIDRRWLERRNAARWPIGANGAVATDSRGKTQLPLDAQTTFTFGPSEVVADLENCVNLVYLGLAVQDSIEVPHSAKSIFRDVCAVVCKHGITDLAQAESYTGLATLNTEPAAADIYKWVKYVLVHITKHHAAENVAVRTDVIPLLMHDGGRMAKWIEGTWPLFYGRHRNLFMDVDGRNIGAADVPDRPNKHLKLGAVYLPDKPAMFLGLVSGKAHVPLDEFLKNLQIPILTNEQVTTTGSLTAGRWGDEAYKRRQLCFRPDVLLFATLDPGCRGKDWMVRKRAGGAGEFDLTDDCNKALDLNIAWGVRNSTVYEKVVQRFKPVRSNTHQPTWPQVASGIGKTSLCLLAQIKALSGLCGGSSNSFVCATHPMAGGRSQVESHHYTPYDPTEQNECVRLASIQGLLP